MHPLSDLKIYVGQKNVPEGFGAFTAYRFKLTLTSGLCRPMAQSITVEAREPGMIEGTTDNVTARMTDDGRLLVAADHHKLPAAPVWAKLTVWYPDAEMPDGMRAVVSEWDTGVLIDRLDTEVTGETEVAPVVVYRTKKVAAMSQRMCKGIIRTTSEPGNTYVNYGLLIIGKDMITTISDSEVLVDRVALDRVIGLEPGESCEDFVARSNRMQNCAVEMSDTTYTVRCKNAFAEPDTVLMVQLYNHYFSRVMMGDDGKIIFGHQVDFAASPAVVPPPVIHGHGVRGLRTLIMQRLGFEDTDGRAPQRLKKKGIKVETLLRSRVSMWGDQKKLYWSNGPTARKFNPHTGLPQHRFFRARYKSAQKVSDWAYFEVLGLRKSDGTFDVEVKNLHAAPALVRPWRAHEGKQVFDVCLTVYGAANSLAYDEGKPFVGRGFFQPLIEAGLVERLEDADILGETTLKSDVDAELIELGLTAHISVIDASIFSSGDILYFPEVEASEGMPLLACVARAHTNGNIEVKPINNFYHTREDVYVPEIPDMPKGTPVQILNHNGVIMAGLNRMEAMGLYEKVRGFFGFRKRHIGQYSDRPK